MAAAPEANEENDCKDLSKEHNLVLQKTEKQGTVLEKSQVFNNAVNFYSHRR